MRHTGYLGRSLVWSNQLKLRMIRQKKSSGIFFVVNEKGLHTRPSAELVKCATHFKSQVYLSCRSSTVNAKSILGVLMLAAEKGAKVEIEAVGEDADLAVETLLKLAQKGFNITF